MTTKNARKEAERDDARALGKVRRFARRHMGLA
jgi:hypothetical protein